MAWARPAQRRPAYGSAGFGRMVPMYDGRRVNEVLGLIASHLQSSADNSGTASLADSLQAVLGPLRDKGEHLPKDITFDQKMRWHPTYVALKKAKKLRGGTI